MSGDESTAKPWVCDHCGCPGGAFHLYVGGEEWCDSCLRAKLANDRAASRGKGE